MAAFDHLSFLTDEEVLRFFHCKKTEISCLEQPQIFLNQLRDYDLIPETTYLKASRAKSQKNCKRNIYEALEWLETKHPDRIRVFWKCVFQEHVLQHYPTLRLLRNILREGSPDLLDILLEKVETAEQEPKPVETNRGKKAVKKQDKEKGESEEDEPGSSSQSTLRRKGKARTQKPSFGSPLKKGQKKDIWNWPVLKRQLPVQCGHQTGTLDPVKLERGEPCILANGRWYLPNVFEALGQKKTWKNWKRSITCNSTTLQKLIKEGHLTYQPFKRRYTPARRNQQRRRGFSSRTQSSNTGAEAEGEDGEEREREAEPEDSDDELDLSIVGDDRLPVSCGSAGGVLHKERFASGTRGKCIRTEERWLTPEEFTKVDPTMSSAFWKKDIRCHGKPLMRLIEKEALHPHSLLCKCKYCDVDDLGLLEQENDDDCFICDTRGELLCCEECPRSFHHDCHLPAVNRNILGDTWICTFCVLKESQQWRYPDQMSHHSALEKSIAGFMLHCQYLLLCLNKEDKQHIFKGDPRIAVQRYAEFIQRPMWLDRVTEKLQNGTYTAVGEFVSDIRLIFDNCATFNRDNDFGAMGAHIKEFFEEEFQKIFRIAQ